MYAWYVNVCMRAYDNTSDKISGVKMLIGEYRLDLLLWPL